MILIYLSNYLYIIRRVTLVKATKLCDQFAFGIKYFGLICFVEQSSLGWYRARLLLTRVHNRTNFGLCRKRSHSN